MTKEQIANILGFNTAVEMELFCDVCEGYFINQFPSKQECLEIIKTYGLQNVLNEFQNMSKSERLAYELHKLTGALTEAVNTEDFKATGDIISSILKKGFEFQEHNVKELEPFSNRKK